MKTSRSQRAGGIATAASFVVAVMAIVTLMTAVVTHPVQAAPTLPTPATDHSRQSGGRLAALLGLLGKVETAQLAYLFHWPTARLERLRVWIDLGIEFAGPWTSEELDLMVAVLDAFGGTLGEARVAELAKIAVMAASGGLQDHLHLVKAPGYSMPAAYWLDQDGEVVFLEGLFDDTWFADNYRWTFLQGSYAHLGPDVTLRHVVIGHELGHVLIDGLRVEVTAAGSDPMALETLYRESIEPAQWPHLGYGANEDLASELSVWALGVERTEQVDALRATLSGVFADATAVQ